MERFAFDDDYVRRLREGDPATADHFYAYFGARLPIKLRKMGLHTKEEIEDAIHDTYTRVLDKVNKGEVRNGQAFGAFVSTTAEYVVFEHRRSGHVRRSEEFDPLVHDRARDIQLVEHLIHVEIFVLVLAGLDKRDADLLRAKLDEEDNDELCRRFGCDAEYLRVLLFRAKERFRKEYVKRFGKRSG